MLNKLNPQQHSIPLYFLEDDVDQLKTTVELVDKLAATDRIKSQVLYAGADVSALLTTFTAQNKAPGIFFLDIEIGQNTEAGINAAEQIRQLSDAAQIVFLTAHPDKSQAILQHYVVPRAMIEKSEISQREYDHLNQVFEQSAIAIENLPAVPERCLLFNESGNRISLAIAGIDYIETVEGHNGMLQVFTATSVHMFRNRIKNIEEQFPELIRSSQSSLVNPINIQSLTARTNLLVFKDGMQIYVARRFAKRVKAAWAKVAQ